MSNLTHGMKKRFSKATTRDKKIEANISAAYTAGKKQLLREKKTLADALDLIEGVSAKWGEVAGLQKQFAELVETEAPIDGALHESAAGVVSATRGFHAATTAPAETGDAVAKMTGHVKAYIAEIESVEADFKSVETLFTETQRYEKKVGKLSTKESKDRKAEKLKRNMDKLAGARASQQSSTDGVVERMKKTSDKFEAVLQCAQTAFWVKQNKFVAAVTEATAEVRAEALAVSPKMEKIDVSSAEIKVVETGTGKTAAVSSEVPAAAPVETKPAATVEATPAPAAVPEAATGSEITAA